MFYGKNNRKLRITDLSQLFLLMIMLNYNKPVRFIIIKHNRRL